jgi:hypothetical protein
LLTTLFCQPTSRLPEGKALSLTDFLSLKSMQDNIILDRSMADIDGNTREEY